MARIAEAGNKEKSRGFNNRLSSLPNTATLEEVVAVLERDGCVIVRELLDNATVGALKAELAPYLQKTRCGGGSSDSAGGFAETRTDAFLGFQTKRSSSLVAKSRTYTSLVTHPLMLAVCDAILGPHCVKYQVSATQAIQIGPGEAAQPFHRDDALYPVPHPLAYQFLISSIWAMTDFTAANGATRVVPGSHQWNDERVPQDDEVVAAEMPRGSVVLYLGSTLHGGGPNSTDGYRLGVYLGYSLGWLRQEENQYLVVPPEVARTLPERVQRLIGYQLHGPFLGWVELEDPHVVLEK
jgi:ectoine hydroxylase-related dioxygenase (phytanoyl-CoA dioxygenase family)